MRAVSKNPVITVQSASVDLGDVLPQRARESVLRVARKYFGRLNAASVYFHREGPNFRCTVNVQMGRLGTFTGEAVNEDCYLALDEAVDKVATQLRRRKRALRDTKPVNVKAGILEGLRA